jgi:hypothetical protein
MEDYSMAQITLPPGEYRFSRTLRPGDLSLREGREFVVTGTLGAFENDILELLQTDLLKQDALAASAPKGD